MMSSKSYALFQTRNNDGSGNFESKNNNYNENFVSFTTFKTEEFKNMLIKNNYEVIENKFGYELNVYDDMKESLRRSNYEYFFVKKF